MASEKKPIKKETVRRRRTTTETADWGGVDNGLLGAIIGTITADGGAVRFGYSKDGGAYSVGIYGDGKPFTEYCPGTGDVTHWLTGILEDYS